MSEDHIAIARGAYQAFARGGVDAILDYLDPDVEWRMLEYFTGEAKIFHGHAGVRQVVAIFTQNIDAFEVEPLEFIDVGGRVVVPIRLHGLAKGTSDEVRFDLVHVWTTRNRRGVRLDVYASKEQALASVGAKA